MTFRPRNDRAQYRRSRAGLDRSDEKPILPTDRLVANATLTIMRRRPDQIAGDPSAWRTRRAGSLRSLNMLAASLALRMIEDFVAERIVGSLWARLDYDENGVLSVSYPAWERDRGEAACELCARSGEGDDAFDAR
jgi:hypothetical protein